MITPPVKNLHFVEQKERKAAYNPLRAPIMPIGTPIRYAVLSA